MSRLDVVMVREYTNRDGEKKSAFTKIGAAFPLKAGNGYQAVVDAMPAPIDGQYKFLLMEPKKDSGSHQSYGGRDDFGEAPF